MAFFPIFQLRLGFVLQNALALLDLADELVSLAGNDVKIVVSELAPLLTDLALELFPISCNSIFVHKESFFYPSGLGKCQLIFEHIHLKAKCVFNVYRLPELRCGIGSFVPVGLGLQKFCCNYKINQNLTTIASINLMTYIHQRLI